MKRDDIEQQDLAREAQSGDKEAFSKLVRIHMKPLYALTYRMTSDRDAASDLVQETLVSAWLSIDRFRGESQFGSWLHRIAVNKCLDFLSKRRELPLAEDFEREDPSADLDRKLEQQELKQDVLKFMSRLPTQQRAVFDLRFYSQKPFAEIAEITGSALGTVKTNYREAIKKLRVYATERGWQ
ncbi:MAG: sigma-70 family RNA polymerase sigma factor [candidate division Zixibacteria bacterium]